MKFVPAVSKALSVWSQTNPAEFGATVKDVMGQGGALVAYNTLAGNRGGVEDGAWVLYWPDLEDELVEFLESSLARPFRRLERAIEGTG